MTKLCVSDMHHDYTKAQQIINRVPHDSVVFLGDYWDQFKDKPEHAYLTAQWLEQRMAEHPEDEFIIGNHDTQYLWGVAQCSGFSQAKKDYIWAALSSVVKMRQRMKLFSWVDGWLITHAGLTNGLHPAADVHTLLPIEAADCMRQMEAGNSHYLIEAGADRGGWRRHGGINWVDFGKFEPIPGVKQLFGHTLGSEPRNKDDNWCIDTKLEHYALITDGELTIHQAAS